MKDIILMFILLVVVKYFLKMYNPAIYAIFALYFASELALILCKWVKIIKERKK